MCPQILDEQTNDTNSKYSHLLVSEMFTQKYSFIIGVQRLEHKHHRFSFEVNFRSKTPIEISILSISSLNM